MRLILLAVAATLLAGPRPAQGGQPSSPGATPPPQTTTPVSLERIREGLARSVLKPIDLKAAANVQPDFKVVIERQLPIERFFRPEDFKGGPVPGGGLYGYELQRAMAGNPNRNPLAQPFAGFTGAEFAQVAATSVLFDVLARFLTRGMANLDRASDEQAARAEVERAIREYCAAQPGGGSHIEICTR
jgi:hypothetical protein